jgi:23S rRNA (cytidine1920-2'-O)/16S rRNA (cytidine1409-2'-O)-methyltransferase
MTNRPTRKRLDILLVERGLAETRAQAQALVMAGRVRGYKKAGQQVAEDAEIELVAKAPFVSRGGEKLAHALDVLGVDPAGMDCLDVGASTGGFTDCLLQRGVRRVIALDVGYGQLAQKLRDDSRVIVLERVNARELSELPFAPELVVCDVSFISLRLVLPPTLAMVKPQFEAGKEEVGRGGVIRDPEIRRRVVLGIAQASLDWHARVAGVVDSGLPGPKGNREIFIQLVNDAKPKLPAELEEWTRDATK